MAVTVNGTTGVSAVASGATINTPTLVAPVLGTPTSGTLTNCTIPSSALPTGSVIQTVQMITNTQTATSSTTPTATAISLSITPTSSSSKILVMPNVQGINKSANAASYGVHLYLYRGASSLYQYGLFIGYSGTTFNQLVVGGNAWMYLDSPATTSSVTYTIYLATSVATNGVAVNNNGDYSTLTLMEIHG